MMEQVQEIRIDQLRGFKDHPFQVKDNEELQALCDSIREYGVLSPLLARPTEDGYEIISGHRRKAAALRLGLDKLPVLVRDMTDDEAVILMVDSNLQRENLLPSEKAFAYKMKLDAMSRQGFRSDLTSDQVGRKLETADIIAQQSDDSKTQVRRYIRLTHLVPELLDLMDEGKMALSVGVELSFLDGQSQYDVLEQCEINDCTPSYSQAVEMKKQFQDRQLSTYNIGEIMAREKPNQRETIKIPSARLEGKIPSGYTLQQKEDFIVKAVDHYNKYRARQRDRDSR